MKTGNILEQIGNTPLIFYRTINNCSIYLKLEMFNPSGSIKDRIAKKMVENVLMLPTPPRGLVEATSGNTGISLAFVCSHHKIPLSIFMPDTMSHERIALMKAYGAKIVLTPGHLGMSGAINKAQEFASNNNYLYIDQFHNAANVLAHKETTAKEIYRDLPQVTTIVAGIGTGGTIIGIREGLKELLPNLIYIGVEPFESPTISLGQSGAHLIQGIGAGFIPPLLNQKCHEYVLIPSKEAIEEAKILAQEGLLLGISSAATIKAACEVALRSNKPETILAICPDGGIKYLSTGVYDET